MHGGDLPNGFGAYLSSVGERRRIVELEAEHSFFKQGDPADSLFYLEKGRAKLSVVSPRGKWATIMIFSPGDIFGEESLAMARGKRAGTISAVTACSAVQIAKAEMSRILHRDSNLSEKFLSYMLARSLRFQGNLVDQIMNSSENWLPRMILLPADNEELYDSRAVTQRITHETLVEMAGASRSRAMNRFRSLGLIDFKGRI